MTARSASLIIAATIVGGCTVARPAADPAAELALGRAVFERDCAVCHSIEPPPVAAPPMSHIARHYRTAEPDRDAAIRRIAAWIAAPSESASALPAHAVAEWGLMPPLALPSQERRAVAAYVMTLGSGQQQRGMMGGGMRQRHGQHEELTPELERHVTGVAAPAAAALRAGLLQRLTAALAGGDVGRAIEVCATEALPLTDSIAAAAGNGIALKRTSTRVRNPLNAPDALEQQALEWFAAEHAAGREPTELVQREGTDFRYYVPLRVAAPCLTCHGPVDALTPEVRRALESRYPGDRATGYAIGDLRGVLRVSVPASAVH
jgi:mono/diheme cytochrome c family protein